MRESGLCTKLLRRVEADKPGKTGLSTMGGGKIIKLMATADCFILMEIFTKDNGLTTRHMEMERIFTLMGQSILVSGETTSSMVKASKSGLTGQDTRETTCVERKTATEHSTGLTDQFTKDISKITI